MVLLLLLPLLLPRPPRRHAPSASAGKAAEGPAEGPAERAGTPEAVGEAGTRGPAPAEKGAEDVLRVEELAAAAKGVSTAAAARRAPPIPPKPPPPPPPILAAASSGSRPHLSKCALLCGSERHANARDTAPKASAAPGAEHLSGWSLSAALRYAFLISASEALLEEGPSSRME